MTTMGDYSDAPMRATAGITPRRVAMPSVTLALAGVGTIRVSRKPASA